MGARSSNLAKGFPGKQVSHDVYRDFSTEVFSWHLDFLPYCFGSSVRIGTLRSARDAYGAAFWYGAELSVG